MECVHVYKSTSIVRYLKKLVNWEVYREPCLEVAVRSSDLNFPTTWRQNSHVFSHSQHSDPPRASRDDTRSFWRIITHILTHVAETVGIGKPMNLCQTFLLGLTCQWCYLLFHFAPDNSGAVNGASYLLAHNAALHYGDDSVRETGRVNKLLVSYSRYTL